ncbi:hypothetical protein Rhe02_44350 [Rhizocola hellebori]|uniref:Uncharacterized protein n=1 Tax=Rhizocola hellebori TaxID=1392758 RepID=A0A8J3QAY2_9ACTN|nr:type II toxin-antitoxin system PemK/MazF family toxin [Rhizocola hellebori]GIH06368.1 hypothetical protein Rhe02_44350 [Rhizocola hellebori]
MWTWLWRIFGSHKAKPGEIWWADVPFEDGPGSKVRPCLILRLKWRGYDILKITSQDQSHRRDHIEITTRAWDRNATKNSYLDLSDPIRLRERALDNRAGSLDAPTWTKVRRLHGV